LADGEDVRERKTVVDMVTTIKTGLVGFRLVK
jgi:hypothetical protein